MSRPWYRRFPDNFIAGTVGLTLEEKGAYSLVLDLMYVRGGPVPDEPRYIAGVCNCSVRKWNAIREKLIGLGKIHVVDGYLTNERAEKEIEISLKDAQERAENGAKGGNKSAETRAVVSKNKGLGQAPVQLARATQYQHQLKKEGNLVLVGGAQDDSVVLDRIRDDEMFEACEAISGKVKSYLQRYPFPSDIVAQAAAAIKARRGAA